MKSFEYIINDELGIHARPAGEIVKLSKGFKSKIMIKNGEKQADASRLISLMGLGIKQGTNVRVTVEGEDESKACKEIQEYFEKKL